jgi:multimeric flavodoxin WrbA
MEGAQLQGAQTELVHLYDMSYKGCESCFSCKLKGGKSYGACAVNDELAPVLKKIPEIDALVLGSPIYLGAVTGLMRSFLERLTFPYLVYDVQRSSLFKRKMPVAFIYTMGAPENMIKDVGYDRQFNLMERILTRIFGGSSEWMASTDTCQFDDYTKYESSAFDKDAKAARRKEVFPTDCQKAFDMGKRIAG